MPAARISLDFDNRKLYDTNGVQIQALSGKMDSVREYELSILQSGEVVLLPAGSAVSVALAKVSDPPGTVLVEVGATSSGWGTGTRWFFVLDLSDEGFESVLGQVVSFEILLALPDGQHIPSQTIPFTVQKNLIT